MTNRSPCHAGETKDVGSWPRTIGKRTNRGIDALDNPVGGLRRQRRRGSGARPGFVPIFILGRELESRRWRRASRVPVPGAAPRSPAVGSSLATWLGRGFPGVGAKWARLERVVARFGGNHAGPGGLRGDLRRGPQVLAPGVRGIGTGRRPRQPLGQALDLPGAGRRAGPADRHRQSGRPQSARRVDRGGARLDSADPARRRPDSPDARTARPFEVTSTRATPSLDIHLGDDQ